jgi:glycolate oxidase
MKGQKMSRVNDKKKDRDMKKELFLATQLCMSCKFCTPVCPLYSGWLTDSATGRMQSLHYALKQGKAFNDEKLRDVLYACTTCGHCEYRCKSLSQAVKVTDIVKKARRMFVKAGKGPMPVHKVMIENLKAKGNPLGEPAHKRKSEYPSTFQKKDHAETLVFFGCVTSYQDFETIPSTFQIMEGAHIDFTALEVEEYCCGYIAHLVGEEEDFEKCKEMNMKSVSKIGPKQLVTTCAGCFRTFKELYPEGAFNGVPIVHIVQYMEDLIRDGKIRFKSLPAQKVIYHDPCDLGRHLGVFEPPRNILKQIQGVELIEFESNRYNADCCGGGGGYKAVNVEKSLEVASKRVEAAARAGAEVILSACPSCKRNLQLAAELGQQERKWKIQVMDITEFVAQAMRED